MLQPIGQLVPLGGVVGDHIHANLNQVAFQRLVALIPIASGLPLLLR